MRGQSGLMAALCLENSKLSYRPEPNFSKLTFISAHLYNPLTPSKFDYFSVRIINNVDGC